MGSFLLLFMFQLLAVNACFLCFVFVRIIIIFVSAALSLVVFSGQSNVIVNFPFCSAVFSEGSVFLYSPPSDFIFYLFAPRVFFPGSPYGPPPGSKPVILPVLIFLVHVVIFGGTLPFVYPSHFF